MRKINVLILLFFVGISMKGQNLDKNYVDKWIAKTFPDSKIDKDVVYILNGFPVGSDTLNVELSKYKRDDLTTINFIDRRTIELLNFCKPLSGIILIVTTKK